MTAPAYPEDPGPEQPFISHLIELRDRILRMLLAIALALLVLFPFANDIYTFVAEPIRAQLPAGSTLIATQVASPFMTPFKLVLVSAVFVAMPYVLYQLWGFVAPGLYQHEKRFALPLLASSITLFYLGMAFAYFVVFPLVFAFFAATTPEGVAQMPDISYYLDFVLTLFFAFGAAFQIPIATILLVAVGLTSVESLVDKRSYVIVACFVIGMLLTPPDVISQTLLAVPMWMLYEAGIFFSRFFIKGGAREDDESVKATPPPPTAATAADPREAAASATKSAPEPSPAPPPPASGAGATSTLTDAGGVIIGRDIDGGDPLDRSRFVPLTPEEMEAELDAIEAAEADLMADEDDGGGNADAPGVVGSHPAAPDPIDALLERVRELRDLENEAGARQLLYRVLIDGNESQRFVAMNILAEMDRP